MSASDRLLARLRERDRVEATTRTAEILLEVLARGCEVRLERTRAGSEQLALLAFMTDQVAEAVTEAEAVGCTKA